MSDKSITVIVAIVQVIVALALAIIAWLFKDFLPPGTIKAYVILALGIFMLWPVKYRGEIRIPYILVGFCELAIVVFDRFKPPA